MRLRILLCVVGSVTTLWVALGVPARATYGARTTADEPQYLLSAISLAEDLDLDISDELEAQRWRDFHAVDLPRQTAHLADDRQVSPHDPLLPLLLAVPVAAGGWVGAKALLAVLAGLLAALTTWVAVRRFAVRPLVAGGVVLLASLAAPLATYGTQVYPELPAALATMVAVAAVTGRSDRGALVVTGLAVTALPWLSIKYGLVAFALAGVACHRLLARPPRSASLATMLWFAAGLAASGFVFLLAHRLLYGGFTAYAAGDHFVDGELTAVGSHPSYVGRSARLVALLVDRSFGLVAWSPVYVVAIAALAALLRRRPPGSAALALPLAAGWFTATFVAFTMHGWWWPGRQVVVVVPLAVVALAWWADRASRLGRAMLGALGIVGLFSWLWLTIEVLAGHRRLIVDFDRTANPIYRIWRLVLPDYRAGTTATWVGHGLWLVLLLGVAAAGWRSAAPQAGDRGALVVAEPEPRRARRRGSVAGGDQDAGAGEGADAHLLPLDVDGDGAVG